MGEGAGRVARSSGRKPRYPEVPGHTIFARIEGGGQADIYRAHCKEPGDDPPIVAIKIADGRRTAVNPYAIPELLEEADCARTFDHPNVIKVYRQGRHRSLAYYTMDLVEGDDLCTRLDDQGALAEQVALRVAQDIAKALAHIHERGWVHRDVKPENILLDETGEDLRRAVLIDFGLARDMKILEDFDGTTVGTTFYFSPEQCLDPNVGPESDVYSLGTTPLRDAREQAPLRDGTRCIRSGPCGASWMMTRPPSGASTGP